MTSARPLPFDDGPSSPTSGALRLQVLGPLRIWRGDQELDAGPRQQRCLLALLIAHVGHPISTPDLVELIWGADAPASAVNVIHKYVGILRRLLEPDVQSRAYGSFLLRHGNGYRFTADAESLDLIAFRTSVTEAKANLTRHPERALELFDRALRLCHGNAGEALADNSGASSVFAGLDREFFDAVTSAADVAVRLRRPTVVLPPLRLASRMSRYNEPVHASLMIALAALGLQAEALSVFQEMRVRLSDDLGIDPGHDLQEAHRRVLAQAMPSSEPAVLSHVSGGDLGSPRLIKDIRPAQLPPDLPLFVGRETELERLAALLGGSREERRNSPLIVALDGMGGVGKSTLATHFAHAVAEDFTDGQLYLDLRGDQSEEDSLTAGEALSSLLYALGMPASNVPGTFDARRGTYRSLTAGKNFLLLLDNVRDAAQVRPLLPNSAGSLVVITSRRRLVGLAAFDGAHMIQVDVPDRATARELFERRLAGQVTRVGAGAAGGSTVDEIVELCGRLPLALAVLAARLIARPALSPDDVVAELRDGANRLGALPGGRETPDPRTAFSWSYRQLSLEAARLFRLMSLALSPGVTAEACSSLAGRDPADVRTALAELAEVALVTEHEAGCYSSHVLVRAYAEELLLAHESVLERETATSRLLQHYLHSSFNAQALLQPYRAPIVPAPPPPGVTPEHPATFHEAIVWFTAHREVLLEAVRHAADLGNAVVPWQLALTMQPYLQGAGYFQEWEDAMQAALRAARHDHDEIGEAHALRSLAGARFSFGAGDEAIGLLAAAQTINAEHDMVLEQGLVHSNLRSIHNAADRDQMALEHAEKALRLYRVAGDRHAETIGLWGVGQAMARLGRLSESTASLECALHLALELGHVHVESEIRSDLAANLVRSGRPDLALEQLRQAAEATTKAGLGPYELKVWSRIAELLSQEGDAAGARDARDRAQATLLALPEGGTERMRTAFAALTVELDQVDGG